MYDRAVQPQEMARILKFLISEVEGLYYLCSENKGADQLCGYRAADRSAPLFLYHKQKLLRFDYPKQICLAHPLSCECFIALKGTHFYILIWYDTAQSTVYIS